MPGKYCKARFTWNIFLLEKINFQSAKFVYIFKRINAANSKLRKRIKYIGKSIRICFTFLDKFFYKNQGCILHLHTKMFRIYFTFRLFTNNFYFNFANIKWSDFSHITCIHDGCNLLSDLGSNKEEKKGGGGEKSEKCNETK